MLFLKDLLCRASIPDALVKAAQAEGKWSEWSSSVVIDKINIIFAKFLKHH